MRPLSRFFLGFYSWRCCYRLANCQGTIEAFVLFGERRKACFSTCPALRPGGCEIHAHLAHSPAAPGQGSQLGSNLCSQGCTGVANQRSCCLEEERIVWQATGRLGSVRGLTLCAIGRAFGRALHLAWLMIQWWGKLTEHTKELSYWEADSERKLEKWLLLIIVDKFASVRTDGDRQSHVSRIACCLCHYKFACELQANCLQSARNQTWCWHCLVGAHTCWYFILLTCLASFLTCCLLYGAFHTYQLVRGKEKKAQVTLRSTSSFSDSVAVQLCQT